MRRLNFKELWDLKTAIAGSIDNHIVKRKALLSKFKDLDIEKITEKFSFKTMCSDAPEFCPMTAKNKLCHDLTDETLNCYGCICPDYDLEIGFDEKQKLYKIGFCRINSKFGMYKLTQTQGQIPKKYLILSCINCKTPHNNVFIKKQIINDLKKLSAD